MSNREHNQIIALSALFQSAELVTKLAKTGKLDEEEFRPLMDSIMALNANDTADIYGGKWEWSDNLRLGRSLCRKTLSKDRSSVNPDTIRYALSLLHLQSKLDKQPQLLEIMGQRLQQIIRQREHYDTTTHSNVVAAVSGLYQETLSKLSFRIQVHGDARYLQQTQVADQVRALLMAGVRAAMLWRQLGGHRWHFLLKRKALLEALSR